MRESKHTPGPWRVDANHPDYVLSATRCVTIIYGRPGNATEREANARLIAAAPDMLEALKACQSALASMIAPDAIEQTTVLNAFAQATEAESKARAAISMAVSRALTNQQSEER